MRKIAVRSRYLISLLPLLELFSIQFGSEGGRRQFDVLSFVHIWTAIDCQQSSACLINNNQTIQFAFERCFDWLLDWCIQYILNYAMNLCCTRENICNNPTALKVNLNNFQTSLIRLFLFMLSIEFMQMWLFKVMEDSDRHCCCCWWFKYVCMCVFFFFLVRALA